MRTLKLLALSAALFATEVQAKTLTIGLDLSGSNPLITDKAFSQNAAIYAAKQIAALQSGNIVRVMSFGDRASAANLQKHEFKISKRNRAEEIARKVGGYIASLPERINGGQQQTNIVGWLELTSGFDCSAGSSILVITDGLEASSVLSPDAFKDSKAGLPKPDIQLQGCNVVFFGLGAGWNIQQVKTVRDQWQKYFEAAGAQFDPIIP